METSEKGAFAKHKVTGPIGAAIGLVTAIAAGFFLSEPVEEGAEGASQPKSVERDAAAPGSIGDAPTGKDADGAKESREIRVMQADGAVQPEHNFPNGHPVGMRLPEPEIVVKFRDTIDSKGIIDLFWKDKIGAQEKFARLCEGRAELEGLRLKRVTYSGELVLEVIATDDAAVEALKARYREAVRKLKASPDIAYAEPNATAQPGTRR